MNSTEPVEDFLHSLDPPQPARRIRLPLAQKVGVSILLALVIAALIFGMNERRTATEDRFGPLHFRLEYPTRVIAGTTATFTIAIRNDSPSRVDDLYVHLDHRLVDQSEKLTTIPSAQDPYTIFLGPLAAGETKHARWELSPRTYFRNSSAFEIRTGARTLGKRDFNFWLIP